MNLGTPSARGNIAKIYLYKNKIVKVFNDNFLTKSLSMKLISKNMYFPVNKPEILDVPKKRETIHYNGIL
ncbi:hypothetical protein QUF79_09210 [Fictibacillus enclensis]|uniref:hypothetical protein n=1 Tax=Fictibacillus enclensis TaxID=1017270 RepID=UPI0025A26282|nr:hypothetical protein [Fictibacillus enclensis]MDM5198194.1 hypothetical protein [Fictibacillus enclensis]